VKKATFFLENDRPVPKRDAPKRSDTRTTTTMAVLKVAKKPTARKVVKKVKKLVGGAWNLTDRDLFHWKSFLEVPLQRGRDYASSKWGEVSSSIPIISFDYGAREVLDRFQIFIKMPYGKSLLVWVHAFDPVESLIAVLEQMEGISRTSYYFLHEGKVLFYET
jgi:hypothetical protein